jgi:hypothetical protein
MNVFFLLNICYLAIFFTLSPFLSTEFSVIVNEDLKRNYHSPVSSPVSYLAIISSFYVTSGSRISNSNNNNNYYQVHRCSHQCFWASRDRARKERAAAVERHLGGVRKREDKSKRQLVQVRKVHGHQL